MCNIFQCREATVIDGDVYQTQIKHGGG